MTQLFSFRITKAFRKNWLRSLAYRNMVQTVVLITVLLVGLIRVPLAQASADEWSFNVTPYFWFFDIEGDLRYSPRAGGSPHVEISNSDLLENLDFGLMLSGEARKGRWSIFTDVMYFDLSSQESRVKAIDFNLGGPINPTSTSLDLGTSSSLEAWEWTLAGGYGVITGPTVALDVFGGFRFFSADASTDWQLSATVSGPGPGQVFQRTGSISQSEDLWDAIVGVRGQVRLWDSNWYVPYYFDIGTGDSDLTWQGMLGLSYRFGWGDIKFAYRYLYYDTDEGKLFDNLDFEGPALGLTFRF